MCDPLTAGMQTATVRIFRNVLGLEGAHSAELDPATPYRIGFRTKRYRRFRWSLRLGLYPCSIKEGTLAQIFFMVKRKLKKDIVIVMNLIMTIENN